MGKRIRNILLALAGLLLLVVLIGPFLVPIPPLDATAAPQDVADADSLFREVNGLDVHYKVAGEGEPALVLLHGFGAHTYTWREVMDALGERHAVVAFDRPAFGLTERPMPGEWEGQNPYSPEAQAALTVGLMDELAIDQAVLVGNSAGGSIATLTALTYPDRVKALILVDPAIYAGGGTPAWVRPLLRTPQLRRIGPLFSRAIQEWGFEFGQSAWHDPARFTPEIFAQFSKPLQIRNWDRALWESTLASHPLGLADRLEELSLPVLVITGDDDRIVPTEQSIRLASEIPGAELAVLADCGHVPQEECPEAFLAAAVAFLDRLP